MKTRLVPDCVGTDSNTMDESTELCRAWGKVKDQEALIFFDGGAKSNFISPELAALLEITPDRMGPPVEAVLAAPGRDVAITPVIGKLRLHCQGYLGHEDFYIMPLEGCDVLLGIPCDKRFENASVEFDEETLKPTYRLLWGVPGRSCALNISERLGVPKSILVAAERHLGVANTEVNQVIMDLEKSKRDFEDDITVAEKYLKMVKVLHTNIKEAVELVQEEEQNSAVYASNMLQEEAHKARASLSALHQRKLSAPDKTPPIMPLSSETPPAWSLISNLEGKELVARVGSTVFVPRLGKEAKVVQVLSGKRMVVVQSGSIQLRVSFSDVKL
ncbi:hypothetical protein L7F22_051891 [Adiantum nelumboides]|nr:hypothetical protein [Adiantum nelumboides]